jgi:hypothetical protein
MKHGTEKTQAPAADLRGRPLAAMRVADPPRWRDTVRAALVACGSVPDAAARLGVARRTLEMWMRREPRLSAGINLPGPGRRGR